MATPAQCAAINTLLPRFFGNIPRTVDQDLLFGRIDYHYSDRNTFSASFNYLHFNSPNGLQQTTVASSTGAAVNGNGNDIVRVRNAKVTWMSILSPSLVNNFRYGWDTDLQSDELNPALNGTLGFLDVTAAGVTLGAPNYLPRIEPSEARNEFGDDLSWTRGRHIFKFGVDFATTSDYSLFITKRARQLQLHHRDGLCAGLFGKHHGRQELDLLFPDLRKSSHQYENQRLRLLCGRSVESHQ